MRKMFLLIALCAVFAASSAGEVISAYGAGVEKCSEWNARRNADEFDDGYSMAQWMLGYVSAFSLQQRVNLKATSREMADWLDTYCKSHPQVTFASATREMLLAMIKSQSVK